MKQLAASLGVLLIGVLPAVGQSPEALRRPLPAEGPMEWCQDDSALAPTLLQNTLYMNDLIRKGISSLYRLSYSNGAATYIGRTGWQEVTDIAFVGSTLYGVTFDTFIRINPDTGQAFKIGSIGSTDVNALGYCPANHKLYAAGTKNPGYFLSIDVATGKGTAIGTYGKGLSSAGDIVIKGGTVYATLNRTGYGTSWLAKINKVKGQATLVGDTHFQDVWGLAVRNGTLYGATRDGRLLKINPATGAGTEISGKGRIQQAGMTTSPGSLSRR